MVLPAVLRKAGQLRKGQVASGSIVAYVFWNHWSAFCLWTSTVVAEELRLGVVGAGRFLEPVLQLPGHSHPLPSFLQDTCCWGITECSCAKGNLSSILPRVDWVEALSQEVRGSRVEYLITSYNMTEMLVDTSARVVQHDSHSVVSLIWAVNWSGQQCGADNLPLITCLRCQLQPPKSGEAKC